MAFSKKGNHCSKKVLQDFQVKKVPTFVFYKNGLICNSLIGTNKEKLEEYINEYL